MLSEPQKIESHTGQESVEPLVSICCLTYAHGDFIEDTIEGFLMQETTFRVEILIHDDASPDKTAEIVQRYESKFPELIRGIYQQKNQYSQGVNPEEEFLFPLAKGRYIALCEGDDYWTDPLKLQKQVTFLEKIPEFSTCVGGYTRLFEDTQNTEEAIIDRVSSNYSEGFEFTLQDMQEVWLTKTLTAVFRKTKLQSVNLSNYNYYRDIHLFYHLVKNSKAFYFRENFGIYRIHEGGVNSMKQGKVNQKAAYHCYKELYLYNKDEFTRKMCLKSTLSLLNYNLFNRYEGNGFFKNLRLLKEAIPLINSRSEWKMVVAIFLKREWKDKIKG